MDMSFYTAAAGASAQQSKLDVVANNIANIDTYGLFQTWFTAICKGLKAKITV